MLYMPGEEAILSFRVPDANGDNISGLTFTTEAITKDDQRIITGSLLDNLDNRSSIPYGMDGGSHG